VLVDLSCVLWSSEEDGVASFWCSKSEFVQRQAFSTGSLDSLLCSLCESEGSDRQFLLEVDQSCIVGDGSNDNDGLLGRVGFAVCHLSRDARYGYGWSVGSALKKSLQDDLVEAAVGSSSKEAVELDEEEKVGILRLWRTSVAILGVGILIPMIVSPTSRCILVSTFALRLRARNPYILSAGVRLKEREQKQESR